eukprot:tig00020910_g15698.t1
MCGAARARARAQDVTLRLSSDCVDALSQRSLRAWSGVRTLHLLTDVYGWALPARFLARVASETPDLRELAVAGELAGALPLPAGVPAALGGRPRRLPANAVDPRARKAAHGQARQRAQQAELESALGIRVEPYFRSDF